MPTSKPSNHFISEWTLLLMLLSIVSIAHCQSHPEDYSQNNVDEQNYPYVLQLFQNSPSIERRNDFFLKASKSVPRIGRRGNEPLPEEVRNKLNLEIPKYNPRIERRNDFFLKASKSVPRIGRRDDIDLLLTNYPSISKRNDVLGMIDGVELSAWPWFRNPDLYPKVYKKSGSKVNAPLLQIWEADSNEPWNSFLYHDQDFLHKEQVEPRLQAEV